MFINIIKTYRDVVAVCDSELLGKYFEEGNSQLDIKESFYKGRETSEKETIILMRDMAIEDATFNIVGRESTTAALKARIISKDQIGEIDGIPFALILI